MYIAKNKALVRQAYDFLNRKDLTAFFELLAPDYIEHLSNMDMSLEQAKQYEKTWLTAFPDFSVTIIDIVAEDDKMAVRLNWEGTHLGQFMGIPPTGNKIDISTANTIRILAGKWVELWNVSDSLRFMQQIGVIPSKQGIFTLWGQIDYHVSILF